MVIIRRRENINQYGNIEYDLVEFVIQDEGKSMKTGGRYHQTKEGGSYHTDSPQWPDVPDSVGLLCINPAKEGGINKFLSAYSIHNEINKKDPFLLELLYSKFYFVT